MIHATNAPVMNRQTRSQPRELPHAANLLAALGGSALSMTTRGYPSTINGAATIMSNSCCTMWAENSTEPHGCSGETSAMNRTSQPAPKHAACQRRTPRPTPPLRQYLASPRPYSAADSARQIMLPGSQPQVLARSCHEFG